MTKNKKSVKKYPLRYVANTHLKKRPLAFVDLEFSGLGAENEILQIGCVLVGQPSFEVLGEWQARVKPRHLTNSDPKALHLIGYTHKKWQDALNLKEALQQFNIFVKGAVLVGYNVVGDFYQLKRSFHMVGLMPEYHWQVLDVLSMLYLKLYNNQKLEGLRMREVVKYYRLKNSQWHDALVDARATYDIFLKLMKMYDQ